MVGGELGGAAAAVLTRAIRANELKKKEGACIVVDSLKHRDVVDGAVMEWNKKEVYGVTGRISADGCCLSKYTVFFAIRNTGFSPGAVPLLSLTS